MSVRRGATRLAAVFALLAGVLAIGATPARAAEDQVELRLPSSFTAGGSPGSVSVTVSKRSDGCVNVRTRLGIRLAGLSPDEVRVRVADDGEWRRVRVSSAGDGVVITERTEPDRDRLCKRRSLSVRYQVVFLDGAPGGTADVLAAAYAGDGDLLGQAAARRTVKGPSPRASLSPSPTPSPTAEPSEPSEVATPPQSAAPALVGKEQDGGGFGMGGLIMVLGILMVGIGAAVLVLLLRQRGADGDDPGHGGGYPHPGPPPPPPGPTGGDQAPTLILPKLPG